MTIITLSQAAEMCSEKLGFYLNPMSIRRYVCNEFSHLGIFGRKTSSNRVLKGIHKSRWLNFLNGRSYSRTSAQLFSTDEVDFL